jgi:hypothetical protein
MKKTYSNEQFDSNNEESAVEETIEELGIASKRSTLISKPEHSKTEYLSKLPIIKNPISLTKSTTKQKTGFIDDEILPSINKPSIPTAPPIEQLLKSIFYQM